MSALWLVWVWACVALGGSNTIAVTAKTEGGPLGDAAVQSAVWHALQATTAHDPLLLLNDEDVIARMGQAHLSTLLEVEVRWEPDLVQLGTGGFMDDAPTVEVTEWYLRNGTLQEVNRWLGVSGLVVTETKQANTWATLPEVALQRALSRALAEVPAPLWTGAVEEPLTLSLVVCADPHWKRAHGPGWQNAAIERVRRASELLRQARLAVEVGAWCEWTPPTQADNLSELLEHLASLPLREGTLRLGLTAHPSLLRTTGGIDEVGRAFTPGRDFVVTDQRALVTHRASWDIADEGVAIAHELLHSLGLPHNTHHQFVMSDVQRGNVHVLAPSTRALARAAAIARYQHWDPIAAVQALSDAADRHIEDPALAVDYVRENLVMGPGVPHHDEIDSLRVSSLGREAIRVHWSLHSSTPVPTSDPCGPGPTTKDCLAPY